MLRSLIFAFVMLLPLSSNAAMNAQAVGSYTGFNFTVSNPSTSYYPSSCNALIMDTNGSISGSGRFAVYGVLNCQATNQGFALTGSGYLTTSGTIDMNITVGIALWICQLDATSLNGSCAITTYTGVSEGSVLINHVP